MWSTSFSPHRSIMLQIVAKFLINLCNCQLLFLWKEARTTQTWMNKPFNVYKCLCQKQQQRECGLRGHVCMHMCKMVTQSLCTL